MIAHQRISSEVTYEDPDYLLVKRAQAGDVCAFNLLVLRHKGKIFNAIFKITKNREDAEDQVQETFLRAYRGLHQFHGNSKFSSWLTRIAVNQALMCLRQRRYNLVSLDEPISSNTDSFRGDIREWRPNPEQCCADLEINKKMRDNVNRLPYAIRSVVILRDYYEYTTQESATALGISAAAVKSRVLRARQRLRDRMDAISQASYPRNPVAKNSKAP